MKCINLNWLKSHIWLFDITRKKFNTLCFQYKIYSHLLLTLTAVFTVKCAFASLVWDPGTLGESVLAETTRMCFNSFLNVLFSDYTPKFYYWLFFEQFLEKLITCHLYQYILLLNGILGTHSIFLQNFNVTRKEKISKF